MFNILPSSDEELAIWNIFFDLSEKLCNLKQFEPFQP